MKKLLAASMATLCLTSVNTYASMDVYVMAPEASVYQKVPGVIVNKYGYYVRNQTKVLQSYITTYKLCPQASRPDLCKTEVHMFSVEPDRDQRYEHNYQMSLYFTSFGDIPATASVSIMNTSKADAPITQNANGAIHVIP